MAYIESHQDLGAHPKTKRAARLLDVSVPLVMGHLHLLWHWALDYAEDGDVTDFEPRELAEAAQWDGDPAAFVEALTECRVKRDGAGFLEQRDGRLVLHDWWDFAGKLIARRRANADRMRDARASQETVYKESTFAARAANVQNTNTARAGANVEKSRESTLSPNGDSAPAHEAPAGTPAPVAPEVVLLPVKPSAPALPAPQPKPNRVAEFIDLVRAAGLEYAPLPADTKALKETRLTADQVAEVYLAVALGEFGDDWQRDHLSVKTAIGAWNGYQTARMVPARARSPSGRNSKPKTVLDVIDDRLQALKGPPRNAAEAAYEPRRNGSMATAADVPQRRAGAAGDTGMARITTGSGNFLAEHGHSDRRVPGT